MGWDGRWDDSAESHGSDTVLFGENLISVVLSSRRQSSMAQIVNSRCVLAVGDLEVSTRYYRNVLGFRKDPINAEDWSFLTRDSFRVMLGECVDERPAGELGNHPYFGVKGR